MPQGNLLSSLSYDTTPRAFVAPPIKEYKELTKAREEDYLDTMSKINEMDTVLRNLPKDYSPEQHKLITDSYNKVMSGVTPENYADQMLNVRQFSSDFVNKMGVAELLDQEKKVTEAKKKIQDAVDKGDIIGDDLKELYMRDIKKQITPIGVDPITGQVSKQGSIAPQYNKFDDADKWADDEIKGWMANKDITKWKDKAGKEHISVSGALRGKMGWSETEEVTEDDLRRALKQGLINRPAYLAYAKDKVRAQMMNLPSKLEPEDIATALHPVVTKKIFGKDTVTPEEVTKAIQEGKLTQEEAKRLVSESLLHHNAERAVALAASKGSFFKKDYHFDDDWMAKMAREHQYRLAEIAKENEVPKDVTDPSGAVVPAETVHTEQPDPTSADSFNKAETAVEDRIKNAQVEANTYKASVGDKPTPEQKEIIKEKEREINDARKQKVYIQEARRGKEDNYIQFGENQGLGLKKLTTITQPEVSKEVSERNIDMARSNQSTVNVTSVIHGKDTNKPYLEIGDKKIYLSENTGIIKNKEGQYIYSPAKAPRLIPNLQSLIVDKQGNYTKNVKHIQKFTPLRPASATELRRQMMEGIDNDKSGDWIGETHKEDNVVYPNRLYKAANKVKDLYKEKDIDPTIQQVPETVLKARGKEGAIQYSNNFRGILSETLRDNPNSYKIEKLDGSTVDLMQYLTDTYDINFDDIKSYKLEPLTKSSPRHGQRYVATITTDKGRVIPLSVVNPEQPESISQAAAEEAHRLRAHADQGTAIGRTVRKHAGLQYYNAQPERRNIDDAIIEAISENSERAVELRGEHFNIHSTSASANDPENRRITLSRDTANGRQWKVTDGHGFETWQTEREMQRSGLDKVQMNQDEVKSVLGNAMDDQDARTRGTVPDKKYAEKPTRKEKVSQSKRTSRRTYNQ